MFRREGLEKQENKDLNVGLCTYVYILCLLKKKCMCTLFLKFYEMLGCVYMYV